VSFTIRDFAFLVIGMAGGALLIIGLDMWMRGRRRLKPPTSIDVPGAIVTFSGTITEDEVAEFKRRWNRSTFADPKADRLFAEPPQIDGEHPGVLDDPRAGLGPERANEGR